MPYLAGVTLATQPRARHQRLIPPVVALARLAIHLFRIRMIGRDNHAEGKQSAKDYADGIHNFSGLV